LPPPSSRLVCKKKYARHDSGRDPSPVDPVSPDYCGSRLDILHSAHR
jgi:hypothetical protein